MTTEITPPLNVIKLDETMSNQANRLVHIGVGSLAAASLLIMALALAIMLKTGNWGIPALVILICSSAVFPLKSDLRQRSARRHGIEDSLHLSESGLQLGSHNIPWTNITEWRLNLAISELAFIVDENQPIWIYTKNKAENNSLFKMYASGISFIQADQDLAISKHLQTPIEPRLDFSRQAILPKKAPHRSLSPEMKKRLIIIGLIGLLFFGVRLLQWWIRGY